MIPDAKQRSQALNPAKSFIVQAPAGSGKTELLTQRVLRLLSVVKQPEEIIAITFTRRAASEMRQRINQALINAKEQEPEAEHKKLTWKLAKDALSNSKLYQWELINNPNRLRIITIDSLAGSICKQIPTHSNFIVGANISKDSNLLYKKAAISLLDEIYHDKKQHNILNTLLEYYDNKADKIIDLLCEMLPKRDQWLQYVCYQDLNIVRQHLENSLQNIASESIDNIYKNITQEMLNDLIELLIYSASNLQDTSTPDTKHLENLSIKNKTTNKKTFNTWKWATKILLTSNNEIRKTINEKNGFPSPTTTKDKAEKNHRKTLKEKMQLLLKKIKNNDDVASAIQKIASSPPLHYQEQQWHVLSYLCQILPRCVAHLHDMFNKYNKVDFVEINMQAQHALGQHESPTDLALQLDYKIQHLLIDEFQDTAHLHYNLIEKIISGWQNDDAKSLFIVGDPMQSIYKFRDADVGLFLQCKAIGVGNIRLQPLTLSSNFRTEKPLLEWINSQCENIFPKKDNITSGAISYKKAYAMQKNNLDSNTGNNPQWIHAFASDKEDAKQKQAAIITNKIKQLQKNQPQETIAILVRSRKHLAEICKYLRQQQVLFSAVDIESLANQPACLDLLALTQALSYPSNDIAWCSVLRAPWCGLTLQSLYKLSNKAKLAKKQYLSEYILSPQAILDIDDLEEKRRLEHTVTVIKDAISESGRKPISQWLQQTWHHLKGPQSLTKSDAMQYCQAYFDVLAELDNQQIVIDDSILTKKITETFVSPTTTQQNTTTTPVQVMTIHKSKGLEFDHVFIPSIDKKSPLADNPILRWSQCSLNDNTSDFILAPLGSADSESQEPIYQYLRSLETEKLAMEKIRLFYVAITRAKKNLFLSAAHTINNDINLNEQKDVFESIEKLLQPNHNSFAFLLKTNYINSAKKELISWKKSSDKIKHNIKSDPKDKKLLRINSKLYPELSSIPKKDPEKSNPAPTPPALAQQQGIIIHKALANLSSIRQRAWPQHINNSKPSWGQALLPYTASIAQHKAAVKMVETTLKNTIKCPRAQWILNDKLHLDPGSEKEIIIFDKDMPQKFIIDRTFLSKKSKLSAQLTRWIIDYKCSTPEANITKNIEFPPHATKKITKKIYFKNINFLLEYCPETLNDITENQLEYFTRTKIQEHKKQLHHYADLYKKITPDIPIMLAIYFPAIQMWCQWQHHNKNNTANKKNISNNNKQKLETT